MSDTHSTVDIFKHENIEVKQTVLTTTAHIFVVHAGNDLTSFTD